MCILLISFYMQASQDSKTILKVSFDATSCLISASRFPTLERDLSVRSLQVLARHVCVSPPPPLSPSYKGLVNCSAHEGFYKQAEMARQADLVCHKIVQSGCF